MKSDIKTEKINLSTGLAGAVSIYLPKGTDSNKVLYFFHGVGGNEFAWQSLYKKLNFSVKEAPFAVGVTFGKSWFLAHNDDSLNRTISVETFEKEIMDYLEKKYSLSGKKRIAIGLSMGGGNAAQLGYRKPQLISKIVLHAASFYPVGPYSLKNDIDKFIKDVERDQLTILQKIKKIITGHSNIEEGVMWILSAQKERYPSKKEWEEYSILDYIQTHSYPLPSTYLSAGTKDQLGLYEAAEYFRSIMKNRLSLTFVAVKNGGHGSLDLDSMKKFILSDYMKNLKQK